MYKTQKKYVKILGVLILFTLMFAGSFQMNPGFIRKDIKRMD